VDLDVIDLGPLTRFVDMQVLLTQPRRLPALLECFGLLTSHPLRGERSFLCDPDDSRHRGNLRDRERRTLMSTKRFKGPRSMTLQVTTRYCQVKFKQNRSRESHERLISSSLLVTNAAASNGASIESSPTPHPETPEDRWLVTNLASILGETTNRIVRAIEDPLFKSRAASPFVTPLVSLNAAASGGASIESNGAR
jgi:hypothetical protein